jgi:hypothetical protein
MLLLWFATSILIARNPFFIPSTKLEVLAYGLKPRPFFLAIQKTKPVIYKIGDKINDLLTIKDINKNSYSLVDTYGNEYNYSFV